MEHDSGILVMLRSFTELLSGVGLEGFGDVVYHLQLNLLGKMKLLPDLLFPPHRGNARSVIIFVLHFATPQPLNAMVVKPYVVQVSFLVVSII